MNFRVYILAIASFVAGTVELIIGGVLDLVSNDLHVSISAAGQLITVYSLVFALAAPTLLAVTSKFERKKLYICTLFVFLIGNILAAVSPTYTWLMAARILTAASGSLVVVLSLTMAAAVTTPAYRGRAIGIIFMGISGSLVLGVPIGMVLGANFGWQAPFILISVLTVISIIGVSFFLSKIPPKPAVPLGQQLATLKNKKILSAQMISFFMLTGHMTLYAYFTPYLKNVMGLNGVLVSLFYFIFGVAAVMGGGVGGWASDKFGTARSILSIVACFGVALVLLPLTAQSIYIFTIVMILWSMLSWAISPAQQNYLIQAAPETSDIQMGLNTTAIHLGIALGSAIGGIVVESYSVHYNAWVGSAFVLLAFFCAVFSLTRPSAAEPAADQELQAN
ncbi:DHA1 family purine base/nucleoside efflux pump-like MFS transporter [Scopulibacillus darangshiensis]|uniref:DHA1 family purine base/nucleoside efflux pump-like MFS transporter n=1 Tax=Scopulibacillus darangshiensis TaxID=442528 RepID=A0A4R2P9N6_9BACL|nr:MFS transporter [Scopulibacillus darangshiensis]TCP31749.1 DHA1 family purine base/nucleoside efflux pump-like MFS transporter [Scopulibacillus darangshiensis]